MNLPAGVTVGAMVVLRGGAFPRPAPYRGTFVYPTSLAKLLSHDGDRIRVARIRTRRLNADVRLCKPVTLAVADIRRAATQTELNAGCQL